MSVPNNSSDFNSVEDYLKNISHDNFNPVEQPGYHSAEEKTVDYPPFPVSQVPVHNDEKYQKEKVEADANTYVPEKEQGEYIHATEQQPASVSEYVAAEDKLVALDEEPANFHELIAVVKQEPMTFQELTAVEEEPASKKEFVIAAADEPTTAVKEFKEESVAIKEFIAVNEFVGDNEKAPYVDATTEREIPNVHQKAESSGLSAKEELDAKKRDTLISEEESKEEKIEADNYAQQLENERKLKAKTEDEEKKNVTAFQPEVDPQPAYIPSIKSRTRSTEKSCCWGCLAMICCWGDDKK